MIADHAHEPRTILVQSTNSASAEHTVRWRSGVLWIAVLLLAVAGIAAPGAPAPSCPTADNESIPPALWQMIGIALPEKSNAGLEFLHAKNSPRLVLSQDATVSVTFLWEASQLRNSLGYFTFGFDANQNVVIFDRQLIFPNASLPPEGTLASGDSACLLDASGALRVFPAGTNIGFFLVSDGYDQSPQIQFWNPSTATIPSSSPGVNMAEAQGVFTSEDSINPEMTVADLGRTRHVATLSVPTLNGYLDGAPFVILGFEMLDRGANSDDDFNDLVITVQTNPGTALMTDKMSAYSSDDADLDGVMDVQDAYPDDAERAVVMRYPTSGFHVLGFEDLYPVIGDADFNDAVVVFAYKLVTDAWGGVKDIQADYHLVARGSALDHSLGLHLPGLPGDATGVVHLEQFLSDGPQTHLVLPDLSVSELINLQNRRIGKLIPSTIAALPGPAGAVFANTPSTVIDALAASSRVTIDFDQAIDPTTLGNIPFDVYFDVDHGLSYDVHLPGTPGFTDRPSWLPVEQGPSAFLDDAGNPWLILVPYNWRFPLEQVPIWSAYPAFVPWVLSGGLTNKDWFHTANPNAPGLVGNLPQAYLLHRDWVYDLPLP